MSALATFRVLAKGDLDADAALASAVGRPRRRVADAAPATALRPEGPCSARVRRCRDCPIAAVLAIPGRLLLSCLLLRSSWLTMTAAARSRRQSAASPGRTAAVAEPVGVAGGIPEQERSSDRAALLHRLAIQQPAGGRKRLLRFVLLDTAGEVVAGL